MLNLKKDLKKVIIHGGKVYGAEDQPRVFKNRTGAQLRITKWQNRRC